MEFDVTKVGELGVGVLGLLLLFIIVRELIKYMSVSNKVVQENTKAINKLVATLDKNSLQEEHFRRELIEKMNDVHGKVSDIHAKVV